MRSKAGCLLALPLLLVGIAERGNAQRAGLWEAQAVIDGTPTGASVRECRMSGAQLAVMQARPAKCVAKPLQHTASGIIAEARCAGAKTGSSLFLRHELTGNLDQRYQIVTSSRIDGAATIQATHRSTVTLRYLGPCAGGGNTVSGSDAAGQPMPAREPLPIVVGRIIIPPILLLGLIAATSWFFRRRWQDRRDQATVTNIVTGAVTRDFYDAYFEGRDRAFALAIGELNVFETPIAPDEMIDDFTPPQSYRYVSPQRQLSLL